jgi:hypothetical protein
LQARQLAALQKQLGEIDAEIEEEERLLQEAKAGPSLS